MGTKTWTTTAEFNTGTSSGLITTGNELALDPTPAAAWSVGGSMAVARYYGAGFGTQGAGVYAGGAGSANDTRVMTENYDGTVWSSGGDLAGGRRLIGGGAGLQNAGLVWGGDTISAGATNLSEEYNGTVWSGGGDLSEAKAYLAGAGTQGAALSIGGFTAYSTEEYDGAAWSAGGALSLPRYALAATGTLIAGLCFGGYTISAAHSNQTEEYNGTTWSVTGVIIAAKRYLGSAGLQGSGLDIGGNTGSRVNATNKYNGATWSSGDNLNTAVDQNSGFGEQTAALSVGGQSPAAKTGSEKYDIVSITSGTWTIEVDGSAIVTFTPIACNIGSTVQARIKTAVNQAGLGAATWVPATGYYTSFPTVVTASNNQWARLEFSLSGAETVQDITLSWAKLAGGNPSSHFGLGINRKLQL